MQEKQRWTYIDAVLGGLCLLIGLWVNGAIPFVMAPTMGQAVWTTGFAQSFANQGLFAIYAINFGIPGPTPIVFGLSGALPTSWLIRIGLHPVDAYTSMVFFWVFVAFMGAYRFARRLMADRRQALLSAALWLCLPIVWRHAGYSMVSLGIALLPFYLYAVIGLFDAVLVTNRNLMRWIVFVAVTTLVSVFMDGYTFVMFAVGTGILALWFLWKWRNFASVGGVLRAIASLAVSFGGAYLLYVRYVGVTSFADYPLTFFRSWGIDLLYPLIPTKGVHWIWDTVGLAEARNPALLFGDSSVWTTTFALPLIVAVGTLLALRSKRRRSILLPLILISVFGWYLSLGPSLKVNSARPPGLGQLMPPDYAIGPTGTALLSENIPGFSSMRASYRWSALGLVGLWALYVLLGSRRDRQRWRFYIVPAISIVLILLFLPHPLEHTKTKIGRRSSFLQMDTELVEALHADVTSRSRVVFIPRRNDFLVNYLAARLRLFAYNVGGDKNILLAQESWPRPLNALSIGRMWLATEVTRAMLEQQLVDVVVIPKLDTLWAAHVWPPQVDSDEIESIGSLIAEMTREEQFRVVDRPYYALVRSSKGVARDSSRTLTSETGPMFFPPDGITVTSFHGYPYSQVGTIADGDIRSDGQEGYLVYGPYVSIDAGLYSLTLFGDNAGAKEARFDVVSGTGTKTHVAGRIEQQGGSVSGVLARAVVRIENPVDDLEVRLFASSDDCLRVTGYRLVPVN